MSVHKVTKQDTHPQTQFVLPLSNIMSSIFAPIALLGGSGWRFSARWSRVGALGSVWESGLLLPAALLRMIFFTFLSRRRFESGTGGSTIFLFAAAAAIVSEYAIIFKWTKARKGGGRNGLPGYAGGGGFSSRDSDFWSSGASQRRGLGSVSDNAGKSVLDARVADWWAWDGVDSFLLVGAGVAAVSLLACSIFWPNPPRLFLGMLQLSISLLDVAPAAARAITSFDAPPLKTVKAGGAWREFGASAATAGEALLRAITTYALGGPSAFILAGLATFTLELSAANMATIIDSFTAFSSVISDMTKMTAPPAPYKSY